MRVDLICSSLFIHYFILVAATNNSWSNQHHASWLFSHFTKLFILFICYLCTTSMTRQVNSLHKIQLIIMNTQCSLQKNSESMKENIMSVSHTIFLIKHFFTFSWRQMLVAGGFRVHVPVQRTGNFASLYLIIKQKGASSGPILFLDRYALPHATGKSKNGSVVFCLRRPKLPAKKTPGWPGPW